jgi:hypothetical protein
MADTSAATTGKVYREKGGKARGWKVTFLGRNATSGGVACYPVPSL